MHAYDLTELESTLLQQRSLLPDPLSGDPVWPGPLPEDHELLRSRYRGCLIAGAIGDALGRPGEGRSPSGIEATWGELRDFHPWSGWVSGPKGTVTDDTQLTMEVARTYRACGCLDPSDFAMRVGDWLHVGRGKGKTCTHAAHRILDGHPWTDTGLPSAGNGAAMRAAPVGLARATDLDLLRFESALSAVVTHADRMAVASTIVLASAVAYLLRLSPGEVEPNGFAAALVGSLEGAPDPALMERRKEPPPQRVRLSERIRDVAGWLDRDWKPLTDFTWTGAFVLESLPAAIWFFLKYVDDPEECLVRAASVGHDCDTIASMAGNMIGALHGLDALPARWRNDLEYHDELIELADGLLDLGLSQAAPEETDV